MEASPEVTAAEVVELRRRLYRPGAGPEDVRRYEAAVAATAAPEASAEPDPQQGAALSPQAVRRRRLALVGVSLTVVLVAVTAVLRLQPPADARAAERPTLEQELSGPERPVTWRWLAPDTDAFHGHGVGVAVLDASRAPARAGRIDLLLAVDRTVPLHWSVLREVPGPAHVVVETLAQQTRVQAGKVPQRIVLRYDGPPPTAVRVAVAHGVGWELHITPTGDEEHPTR
jgi:hypothetical protein